MRSILPVVLVIAGCGRLHFGVPEDESTDGGADVDARFEDASMDALVGADAAEDEGAAPLDADADSARFDATTMDADTADAPMDAPEDSPATDSMPDADPAPDGMMPLARDGEYLGSRRFGASGGDQGQGIATDDVGNVYLTGYCMGGCDLGLGLISESPGSSGQIMLASYDASGAPRFTRGYGSSQPEAGYAIAVASDGSIYIASWFNGATDFGDGVIRTATGLGDALLLALDSAGNVRWTRTIGSAGRDDGLAVATRGGLVAIAGHSSDTITTFAGAGAAAGGRDGYVAVYDTSGNPQWIRTLRSTGDDELRAVSIDDGGRVAVTGVFADGAALDGRAGALTAEGGGDILLASYDASGALRFAQRYGGAAGVADVGNAIATNAAGDIAVAGQRFFAVDFGGGPLATGTFHDAFVAVFDRDGVHRWSRGIAGTLPDDARGVAFHRGGVVVTGRYEGVLSVGGATFSPVAMGDIFVAAFDATGAHRWSSTYGGTGHDGGLAIAASASGTVAIAGAVQGACDFGSGPTTDYLNLDGFVLFAAD